MSKKSRKLVDLYSVFGELSSKKWVFLWFWVETWFLILEVCWLVSLCEVVHRWSMGRKEVFLGLSSASKDLAAALRDTGRTQTDFGKTLGWLKRVEQGFSEPFVCWKRDQDGQNLWCLLVRSFGLSSSLWFLLLLKLEGAVYLKPWVDKNEKVRRRLTHWRPSKAKRPSRSRL